MRLKRDATWVAAAALILALTVAAVRWPPYLLSTLKHARALGVGAPLAFILIHTVGVVALVPATVFAVAGGALFGFTWGIVYSLAGGTCGAVAAFLLGRHLVRPLFGHRMAQSPRLAAMDRAVTSEAAWILFLLRLSPVMPFNLLNYALGVSSVSLRDFVIASVGMLPGTMVAVYAGEVAGEALALAGETHPVWNSSYYAALIAGLAATVLAAVVVGRAASRALKNVA